jgi:SAM-dependent methyltransferase
MDRSNVEAAMAVRLPRKQGRLVRKAQQLKETRPHGTRWGVSGSEDRVRDKRGLLDRLPAPEDLVLELGCGQHKSDPAAIGVDRLDAPCVDIVGEVHGVLARLPDASVGRIITSHLLEHIDDLERLVHEMARVLADGARLEVTVPHFSNPHFYSDPTHRRFFGLYSFSYLARSELFRREVPSYSQELDLELVDVVLAFNSIFKLPRLAKRGLGRIVNAARVLQEFYEEHCVYLCPCYEVRYLVRRLPRTGR